MILFTSNHTWEGDICSIWPMAWITVSRGVICSRDFSMSGCAEHCALSQWGKGGRREGRKGREKKRRKRERKKWRRCYVCHLETATISLLMSVIVCFSRALFQWGHTLRSTQWSRFLTQNYSETSFHVGKQPLMASIWFRVAYSGGSVIYTVIPRCWAFGFPIATVANGVPWASL